MWHAALFVIVWLYVNMAGQNFEEIFFSLLNVLFVCAPKLDRVGLNVLCVCWDPLQRMDVILWQRY